MYYPVVRAALEAAFVYSEDVARVIGLALDGQKNAIIYGPGGHAKSAMVMAAINAAGLMDETFIQFFGEGMSEERLFGGMDFRRLEEQKELWMAPEKSFLNHRIAVFEELFDAPASVLLALKDPLTRGDFRNGAQHFRMKTTTVICLTNRSPSEVAELGPSAQALIERFPLQMELKWKSYRSEDFRAMFRKVFKADPSWAGLLADLIGKAVEAGRFVSPRTAIHAYEILLVAARMRSSQVVEERDFLDLAFVPGMEALAETLEKDLKAAKERQEARTALDRIKAGMAGIRNEIGGKDATPIKLLAAVKRLRQLVDELASLRVHDALVEERNGLRSSIADEAAKLQEAALAAVRV